MSMDCFGCQHDTKMHGVSYCSYYKETKRNMDRAKGSMKFIAFRSGNCSHDTRLTEYIESERKDETHE